MKNISLSPLTVFASVCRCIVTIYAMLNLNISIAILVTFIMTVTTVTILKRGGAKKSWIMINNKKIIVDHGKMGGWEFWYFHIPLIVLNAIIGKLIIAIIISLIIEMILTSIVLLKKARREGSEN